MTLTIKERFVHKFERKTGSFSKSVDLFAKYVIGDIKETRPGWRTIGITGPKQTFWLCECQKPLKVYKPGQPVRELPLFFVNSEGGRFPKVSKIQGATHFALDGEVLIPYKSSGAGFVEEL